MYVVGAKLKRSLVPGAALRKRQVRVACCHSVYHGVSCTRTTKHACIDCGLCYCMPCSAFEEDETSPVWKLGQSVAGLGARLLLEIEQKIAAGQYLQIVFLF